ncbi:MAG: hypothetical protein Q9190_008017, partial [Brigantiaea leucoxantha]
MRSLLSRCSKSLALYVSAQLFLRLALAVPAPQVSVVSSGSAEFDDYPETLLNSPYPEFGDSIEGGCCKDPEIADGKLWQTPETERLDENDCGGAFDHYLVHGDGRKVNSRDVITFDINNHDTSSPGHLPRAYVNGRCVLAMTLRDRFRSSHQFADIAHHPPGANAGSTHDEGTYHDLFDIAGNM